MPSKIYEKLVKPYTIKQWNMSPNELWPSLAGRFNILKDSDESTLYQHKFQGLPTFGYTNFFNKLLSGIDLILGVNYCLNTLINIFKKALIYTGSLDELFNFKYGILPYRAMRHYHYLKDDNSILQDVPIVNYPNINQEYIRRIDWPHWQNPIAANSCKNYLYSYDVPCNPESPNEYAYPIRTKTNIAKYQSYKSLIVASDNIYIGGRLADYQYYDMNHSILNALNIAKQILRNDFKEPKNIIRNVNF